MRVLSFLFMCWIVYHFAVRPTLLSWGAPEKIRTMRQSGDSLSDQKSYSRAIFIHSTPERIWPWMLQLGQERGGFYSYSFLENLALAKMKNVYELRADLQQPRSKGDTIWLASKENYKAIGYQVMALVEPERSIVMTSGEDYDLLLKGQKASGTWAFYLYPEQGGTWLIARSSYHEDLLRYTLYEIPHFIMEEKMLRTIRDLSER